MIAAAAKRPHSVMRLHRALLMGLFLSLLPTYVGAMGTRLPERFPQPPSASPHHQQGNDLLVQALLEVRENQLEAALQTIDALIRLKPNYRLAHLIKGDLLLARARPITTLGSASDATDAQEADLNALREEARVRLMHYLEDPPADKLPKHLLEMQPGQRYAVVVDTGSSRLFLFENSQGEPKLVKDYYVSIGRNGAGKDKEGDRKTPLGVYFVTSHLPGERLTDFYGPGAFPLDYPNGWDKAQGRSGSGIWLHGTPSDTYSRPPRASDGCIVLSNPDLLDLGNYLQAGVTPVIIAPGMEWMDRDEWLAERSALLAQLGRWRQDWERRDAKSFLGNYSSQFVSPDSSRDLWVKGKRGAIAGKSWIKVNLTNLSMFRHPGAGNIMVVTFDQDYSSDRFSTSTRKRQYWRLEDGRWKILFEQTVYSRKRSA
jgi:murein L,D-transpeptidase YafK